MMAIWEKLNCHVPEHGTAAIGHRPKEMGIISMSADRVCGLTWISPRCRHRLGLETLHIWP